MIKDNWFKETQYTILSSGEHCGLKWMVKHNGDGFRCGYAAVPEGHPAYGKHYDDELLSDIDAHGGLTFSKTDKKTKEHWLGFDCAHLYDRQDLSLPHLVEMPSFDSSGKATIKTTEYVEQECRKLCEQLQSIHHEIPGTIQG